MTISEFWAALSNFLWGAPLIILLVGTHIYLTIILRFPQRKIFTAIKLTFKRGENAEGDVSPFGALMASLAATIGAGNIIGVATAIALGGPGAVFWCWIVGILGISTKYGEGLLAIKYRQKTTGGYYIGGPMLALDKGLKMKWLAILFCIFTALAAFGIGNTSQANAISSILYINYEIPTYLTGIILALLVSLVTLFGVKGIARVCSIVVPFMAIFYVIGCLIILAINIEYLGQTVNLILDAAFTPQAAGAGFLGSTLMTAARYGIARGLFSNESGLGSAPIIAAAAQTRNPVRQALISSTGTFWDTVVVCAITGLVIVSSIIAHPDIDYTNGASLTFAAFSKLPYLGTFILVVGLALFTFSTILGWSYYGEKAIEYLGGARVIIYYRIMWIIAIFIGSVSSLTTVWDFSDCMNGLMAIPNLISLLFLSKVLVSETNKYLWSGRLDEYDPECIK